MTVAVLLFCFVPTDRERKALEKEMPRFKILKLKSSNYFFRLKVFLFFFLNFRNFTK